MADLAEITSVYMLLMVQQLQLKVAHLQLEAMQVVKETPLLKVMGATSLLKGDSSRQTIIGEDSTMF